MEYIFDLAIPFVGRIGFLSFVYFSPPYACENGVGVHTYCMADSRQIGLLALHLLLLAIRRRVRVGALVT
jgi:hypothetical protein